MGLSTIKNAVFRKLRNLDAYPKINEDFYSRSLAGGIITIVSILSIMVLLFSEFRLYLHTVTKTKLVVDTSRGETFPIYFDVTFPYVPCAVLSVDAMDISGEQHHDIKHDIIKTRLNHVGWVIKSRPDGVGAPKIEKPLQKHGGRLEKDETYCGSCFGAEMSDDDCCNSCKDVHDRYRKKGWEITNKDLIDQCKREGFFDMVKEEDGEGCNIHGFLEVNKVAGNFHFAPGKSFHPSHMFYDDMLSLRQDIYNISHKINSLTFGDRYPGAVSPLDGGQWIHETSNGVYQYFLKVVPTIYTDIKGRTFNSNQYSVTEHFKDMKFLTPHSHPGVFFFYDFSPIKVTFKEEHISILHFMTHICAVVGGIFTVAGIVDSFVYHSQRRMKQKKMDIGKFR